jgi:hypothetical protein
MQLNDDNIKFLQEQAGTLTFSIHWIGHKKKWVCFAMPIGIAILSSESENLDDCISDLANRAKEIIAKDKEK